MSIESPIENSQELQVESPTEQKNESKSIVSRTVSGLTRALFIETHEKGLDFTLPSGAVIPGKPRSAEEFDQINRTDEV